jgi:hypothetical protein
MLKDMKPQRALKLSSLTKLEALHKQEVRLSGFLTASG